MLPKTLGNAFYKKTAKVPVPVTLDGKDSPAQVEKEIKKALSSTYLHLQPAASTSIRVAMSSFTPEEATENVVAAMKELTEKRIPGGWRNLKSVHIKTPESAALPVWATPDLYTEEDVLKPEEAEEQKKIEEEKAAERAERKKAKIQSKKRKGLSETEPVADEEERSPKKAKSEVEAPKVIETKEPEVEAEAESEEEDNGMEVLVPGDVESSEDEEEVVEEAPKKSLKTKKSAETLKRKKSVDEVKSAAKKTKAASSKGVKAKKPKKA